MRLSPSRSLACAQNVCHAALSACLFVCTPAGQSQVRIKCVSVHDTTAITCFQLCLSWVSQYQLPFCLRSLNAVMPFGSKLVYQYLLCHFEEQTAGRRLPTLVLTAVMGADAIAVPPTLPCQPPKPLAAPLHLFGWKSGACSLRQFDSSVVLHGRLL